MAWVIAVGHGAAAQETDEFPPHFPRWDVSGGLGVLWVDHHDLNPNESWWEPKPQARLQLGRYLTQHLKTELHLSGPSTYDLYEEELFPVAGLSGGGWAVTFRTVKMFTASPALTYQFFENVFAHPFVSGGADIDVGDDHRTRSASTYAFNRVSYPITSVDTRRTLLRARPFFAVGSKSYLNDRVFVRPEAHVAFSIEGASRVMLRLDIGVDF
jgi:hypothetical protein